MDPKETKHVVEVDVQTLVKVRELKRHKRGGKERFAVVDFLNVSAELAARAKAGEITIVGTSVYNVGDDTLEPGEKYLMAMNPKNEASWTMVQAIHVPEEQIEIKARNTIAEAKTFDTASAKAWGAARRDQEATMEQDLADAFSGAPAGPVAVSTES